MTRTCRLLSQRALGLALLDSLPAQRCLLRQRLVRRFATKPTTAPSSSRSSSNRMSKGLDATSEQRLAVRTLWAPYADRLIRGQIFVFALVLGLGAGAWLSSSILQAPAPEPGSAAARSELAKLQRRIDEEFKTRIYRGKCVSAGRAMRGGDAEWVEIDTGSTAGGAEIGEVRKAELKFEKEKRANWEAVQEREKVLFATASAAAAKNKDSEPELPEVGYTTEERLESLRQQAEALGLDITDADGDSGRRSADQRFRERDTMTKNALGGSRGLAVERVFWNAKEAELVAIVWLGSSLCGWPGVIHGGLLATLLSEKASMAAALFRYSMWPAGRTSDSDWRTTDSLQVQYKKPTYAGEFYVVRALPRKVNDLGKDKIQVDSLLETLDGTVTVQVQSFMSD